MQKAWTDDAWADYLYWQTQDKKTLKRINNLLKDIDRQPFSGIGKPEPLTGDKQGYWSRRIDEANREGKYMNCENLNISSMTEAHALSISLWKYDGKYSFYDHTEGNIDGFMDGTHYACTNLSGDLIGYFCFGKNARIPTKEENVYNDGFLDVGLGLRPDLCGKKHGISFLTYGLNYAQRTLNSNYFRLSVAAFNERAIKVYIKAGFTVVQEVTNSYFKNKFFIMTCIR